ncbi:hypothetical protein BJ741DRAFT_599314 [Chytriomyces cf. hyalinus JEL632]|nr:hypothetical protein BJ741DRAFT_599314 [Chytriomyces cf. hyalinus JEL632]
MLSRLHPVPPSATTRLDLLPTELIQFIFSHLNPSSVLKYTRLCFRIRNCLLHPYFALQLLNWHETSAAALSLSNLFLGLDIPSLFSTIVTTPASPPPSLEGDPPSLQSPTTLDRLWFKFPAPFQSAYAKTHYTNLKSLHCQNWPIQTAIPPTLHHLTNLTRLIFRNNSLQGGIPETISLLTGLTLLCFEACGLDGGIPSSLGKLTHLQVLILKNNAFSGMLPESLEALTALERVDVSSNCFSGPVSGALFKGWRKNLRIMNLSWNQFSGHLSPSLCECEQLEELNLRGNQFSGRSCFSKESATGVARLRLLRKLDLGGGNAFSGVLTNELSACLALRDVALDGNNFFGRLPADLGNLPFLERFDVVSVDKPSGRVVADEVGFDKWMPSTVREGSLLCALLTRQGFKYEWKH